MAEKPKDLWLRRSPSTPDLPLPRVSVSEAEKLITRGEPFVVCGGGIGGWYREKAWGLYALRERIKDVVVHNVFASKTNRYKYFRSNNIPPPDKKPTNTASVGKKKMKFSEFIDRSRDTKQGGESNPKLYLYGEPLPKALLSSITSPIVSFMDLKSQDSLKACPANKDEEDEKATQTLTSLLLWVSAEKDGPARISTLHYDLSEGLILQLSGAKRILIFSANHSKEFRPHAIHTPFDRQSKLEIGGEEKDPLQKVQGYQAVLNPGDVLYLPYGYWHYIESPYGSVAITARWNPYEDTIRRLSNFKCLALGLGNTGIPPGVAEVLYKNVLKSSVPEPVAKVLLQRFYAEKEECSKKPRP